MKKEYYMAKYPDVHVQTITTDVKDSVRSRETAIINTCGYFKMGALAYTDTNIPGTYKVYSSEVFFKQLQGMTMNAKLVDHKGVVHVIISRSPFFQNNRLSVRTQSVHGTKVYPCHIFK